MPKKVWGTAAPALLAAGVGGVAPIAASLVGRDLNWCYPYTTADSFDWLANAAYWRGASFLPSLRPPGFPFVLAALERAGALGWLPAVNFAALLVSTLLLFLLLRERFAPWVSALAAWFFFANDRVQDLARYVLSDTYVVPFVILAALAFVRAERKDGWYLVMGAALGTGLLFSYATAPVAVGLAAAVLAGARGDLRRPALRVGAAVAAALAGGWFLARAAIQRAHPGAPRHDFEALVHPTGSNVFFYAVAGLALLGLVVLPLYVEGFRRLAGTPGRFRSAVVWPASALLVFTVFFYDWADGRFLVYVFPFFVCALAAGMEGLAAAATNRRRAWVAGGYVVLCLLWNQLRYPSYDVSHLALGPRRFLEFGTRLTPTLKTVLDPSGARVVVLHGTIAGGFTRGLFDPRQLAIPCAVPPADASCIERLGAEARTRLPAGDGISFRPPPDWPPDVLSSVLRVRNAFDRPVYGAADARFELSASPSASPPVAACGRFVLAPTRP